MAKSTPRRTQSQRSASTKSRLLEAAFECVLELGYAGTSTVEICRRSGVSRGAMLHQYPSKEGLVVATVEFVLARRLAEFRAAYAGLSPRAGSETGAVDLLWRIFSGPTFYVWLELIVAARTRPTLHAATLRVAKEFSRTVREIHRDLFVSTDEDAPERQLNTKIVFAFLTGLAVDRIIPDEVEASALVEVFKARSAHPALAAAAVTAGVNAGGPYGHQADL
jgi:AcrR family transcriptional regulator